MVPSLMTLLISVVPLLFLESENPSKPIHMYLNSPGGAVSAGYFERQSLPNATMMIHQASSGYSGQEKDLTIHAKQIVRIWDSLNALYVNLMGQPIDIIEKNMDRDYFMTAQEAKEFGIVDEVIDQRPIALVTDKGSNLD